jgi:hypothetical protein
LCAAIAALPLIVSLIVLVWRPWVPVLDMAMTEMRVRDVGTRDTPLVGLPGRIGEFPDQGSHPGPWSFYLVAPFYRLAASTAWGMELASVAVNTAAVSAIVWLGKRRYGVRGAVVFGGIAAIAVRGYGLNVLTHPWNPYFPVLLWLLAAIATWYVLMGDHWMALIVVVTTSIAAQTHVPYLVSALALNAVVLTSLCWQVSKAHRTDFSPGDDRGHGPRWPLGAAVGAAAVLWLAPLIEQLREPRGNVTKLVDHFTTEQPEPSIGLGAALRLMTQHLDVGSIAVDLVARDAAFVHRAGQVDGASAVGVVVAVVWLTCVGLAIARRNRGLLTLHTVSSVLLVAGTVSISRIFGKVWFYLTLWVSSAVLLIVLSIAWTAWLLITERRRGVDRRLPIAIATVAGVTVTVASLFAAAGHRVPEENLGEDIRVIIPDVVAALDAGAGAASGKGGSYVVFWQEAVVHGAQGYAVLNELERRGYRVGVHATWRVPATEHRVRLAGEFDAEIHVVSGEWIERWRDRPDHVLAAEYDDRSADERTRFDELEARVDARLRELGRPDMIEVVDFNLFGASLDPDLPDDVVDDMAEMILLGEPVAVFIAPAGSTF